MAKRISAEYAEWLRENNFNAEDEQLILKTATRRTILLFLLSNIPSVGLFTLPLLINAWAMKKIIKQKTFDPNPGFWYSLYSLFMFISFIAVIPLIIYLIVKKGGWGSGLKGLIKKGKVGTGSVAETDAPPVYASAFTTHAIEKVVNETLTDIRSATSSENQRIAETGITGNEGVTLLEQAAAEGNIYAKYHLAMRMKAQDTTAAEGFDDKAYALLQESAEAGYSQALYHHGLVLMNDGQQENAMTSIIAAARKGNHDAIFNLIDFYHRQAIMQMEEENLDCIKTMKQSAVWFKIGLELGVEKLCSYRNDYQKTLNVIEKWEAIANGETPRNSPSTPKNNGRTLIIVVLLIIFLLLSAFLLIRYSDKLFPSLSSDLLTEISTLV